MLDEGCEKGVSLVNRKGMGDFFLIHDLDSGSKEEREFCNVSHNGHAQWAIGRDSEWTLF